MPGHCIMFVNYKIIHPSIVIDFIATRCVGVQVSVCYKTFYLIHLRKPIKLLCLLKYYFKLILFYDCLDRDTHKPKYIQSYQQGKNDYILLHSKMNDFQIQNCHLTSSQFHFHLLTDADRPVAGNTTIYQPLSILGNSV